MQFWEINRIILGYRKRDWLKMQLIAECTYAAMYAMRDPKGKTVKDLFPFLFEEDDDGSRAEITDAEIAELQAEIDAYNTHKQEAPDES